MSTTRNSDFWGDEKVYVEYALRGKTVTLTLNRPGQMNALNRELARQLSETARRAACEPNARVIVIQGAGSSFMAGGDLREFRDTLSHLGPVRDASFGALIDDAHSAIRTLRSCDRPVVACVRGAVAGFGIGLLAACDFAVCSEDAVFKLAYSHIGASPDGGATYALARLAGQKQAMELTMLSDRFDALTAQRIGLVNKVVPGELLDQQIEELVNRLAELPTLALAKTKALIHKAAAVHIDEQLDEERRAFIDCAGTPDFEEGVAAFLERRAPRFGSDQNR